MCLADVLLIQVSYTLGVTSHKKKFETTTLSYKLISIARSRAVIEMKEVTDTCQDPAHDDDDDDDDDIVSIYNRCPSPTKAPPPDSFTPRQAGYTS